jgi:hypothetical protein
MPQQGVWGESPNDPSKRKYKTDEELEDERLTTEYEKSQGISGIAGQGKRARPEYKKGLETFRASRRKKSGMTAKDAGDALAKMSESDRMIEEMAALPLPEKRKKT